MIAMAAHLAHSERNRRWAEVTLLYLLIQTFISSFGVTSKASAASLLWLVLYAVVVSFPAAQPRRASGEIAGTV